MIRGLEFEIPNEYGNAIADILKPLECSKFNWNVNRDEILFEIDGKVDIGGLFREHIVEGKEFQTIITDNYYYTIFIELKAFLKGKQLKEISTYEDFVNSDCEFILLIADGVYAEIYCKDQDLLKNMYNNALAKSYKNIIYKDEKDGRTRMYVN